MRFQPKSGEPARGEHAPEQRMRADRTANGIPLPDDTWAAIVAAARKVGVDERRIQQATA